MHNGTVRPAAQSNHACYSYRTDAELVEAAASFLAAGLQNGERCWYIAKGSEVAALYHALGELGVQVGAARRQGAFRLFEPADIYTAAVPFSPEALMNIFSEGISAALLDGFAGFRAAGEMSWVEDPRFAGQWVEYEHLVTTLLVNSRALGLCLFNVHSPHLHEAIAVHPRLATAKGTFTSNPLFERTYPGREARRIR